MQVPVGFWGMIREDEKGRSKFKVLFERSIAEARVEAVRALITRQVNDAVYRLWLKRHDYTLSGVGFSYMHSMHLVPAGMDRKAGWLDIGVVPDVRFIPKQPDKPEEWDSTYVPEAGSHFHHVYHWASSKVRNSILKVFVRKVEGVVIGRVN